MKKLLLLIFLLSSFQAQSQSCTSVTHFDNIETWTWAGDWWSYSFSNFYTNFSVSPTVSAVHYGSGTSTSGIEQDWYVMPTITGLNPNYTYKVRFKLASYTATSPSATTRGVDAADFIQVQLSRNGGPYIAEMSVYGFSNQTWTYNATGIAAKTANGVNTIYQIATGGARPDGYSTVELTLQPNTTSVAVDIYMRCNSAGEEFWIDNVQLIETIPTPSPSVFGNTTVCSGESTNLTAVGGDVFSRSGGISNGTTFTPTASTTYTVTATLNGMVNGTGGSNTCSATLAIPVVVDPNCILPIYLSSFTGENEGRIHHLYWITEQEINSSHFEIEKSNDGFNFHSIGSVRATNSNPYEFTDDGVKVGVTYYRLKMVDLDQSFIYSDIIALEADYDVNVNIYPNPFEQGFVYSYYSEEGEDLQVFIYDIVGHLIYNKLYKCESCINSVDIYTPELLPGSYTLIVRHLRSGYETRQAVIKKL